MQNQPTTNPTTNAFPNFKPGKTRGQYPNPYPQDFYCFSLGDLYPDPTGKSYSVTELDEPDDEGRDVIYHLPNRYALYELINDICLQISSEIKGYQKYQSSPLDDATSDIEIAIDMLSELSEFDRC